MIRIRKLSILFFFLTNIAFAESPRTLDESYRLQLLVSEPDIVTPVSITFDQAGRLLVVESHTHQRADDYVGPEHDRIRVFEFSDNKIGKARTFYEGTRDTMSLAKHPDGSIFVATRSEIFRLFDDDSDGVADRRLSIAKLQTTGDYPHNGLSGLTFESSRKDTQLYFGMGENLGVDYQLVGSDGNLISGGGEGGNIFRCQSDGANITRVATGFWNPFGNCFDTKRRLFSVDNDPDASPPCRLIHVVPNADYGYQFRYGRSGRHPLQAWDGEFPGTLGRAAGTGEAPCEIVAHEGRLWVASWGDHRIERYTVQPKGATCFAKREIVVQGDKNFRPVGMAIAKDGSIYFSDWVDRSYPVHRKGRIWKLSKIQRSADSDVFPALSAGELEAQRLRSSVNIEALDSDDPFLRQAAVTGLANSKTLLQEASWENLKTGKQRLGFLEAWNWRDPENGREYLERAIHDEDTAVRLYALRIIADRNLTEFRSQILSMMETPNIEFETLNVSLAVLAWLQEGEQSKDRTVIEKRLADIIDDDTKNEDLRVAAMRALPSNHALFSIDRLERTAFSDFAKLAAESIIVLSIKESAEAQQILRKIIASDKVSSDRRSDAIAGLASTPENLETLNSLKSDERRIQTAKKRALAHFTPPSSSEPRDRPPVGDIPAWLRRLASPGDASAGRRVFFRKVGGQCWRCHRIDGRGNSIGPDLTKYHQNGTLTRLLESIFDPNQEISPKYSTVTVTTTDGQVFNGLPLEGPGEEGVERFMKSDGTTTEIRTAEIESKTSTNQSIMPTGLEKQLSVEEIRDLAAFLLRK